MAPTATQKEIARAAGVDQPYVSVIIKNYLDLKLRDFRKKPKTRPNLIDVSVAKFALEKRSGFTPAARTAKLQAVNLALGACPRLAGEGARQYCRRIAAVAGVSWSYVHLQLAVIECTRIGAECRAKAAEEKKNAVVVCSLNERAVQVPSFNGWAEVFGKVKMLADAYQKLARSRGDVYAAAFLSDISERAGRGEERSWMDRKTE